MAGAAAAGLVEDNPTIAGSVIAGAAREEFLFFSKLSIIAFLFWIDLASLALVLSTIGGAVMRGVSVTLGSFLVFSQILKLLQSVTKCQVIAKYNSSIL